MKEFCLLKCGLESTLIWSGIPLFSVAHSIKLFDYCDVQNLAILGFEGFKILGGKRIPCLDYIADFSVLIKTDVENFPKMSRAAARRFFEEVGDVGALFEFVVVEV